MPGHIVVVGSINMDLVVRSPRIPQPGETILGHDFRTFPGGKGANQAVAAARAGGQVKMIGRVGADAFGDSLLATLQKDGIDTRWVLPTSGIASGVALITVNAEGQNNIVVVPGANGQLTPEDVRAAGSAFEGAAVVVLQLEIPLETVVEAVEQARLYHAQVILNPAPARPLPADLINRVDYLIPNESELALLTGLETIETGANRLKSMGVQGLIVTLGSRGALVLDRGEWVRLLPHSVSVVDTTAAGDAFVGGLAAALTEGKPTLEAVAWGNAAGALAVTQAGAQPSLPTRASLEAFMEQNPTRLEPYL